MLVAWLYLIVLKFLGLVIRAQRQIPGPNYGDMTAPPITRNEKMNSGAGLSNYFHFCWWLLRASDWVFTTSKPRDLIFFGNIFTSEVGVRI